MPDERLRIGGWVPPEAQETKQLPVLAARPSLPVLMEGSTDLVPVGPERQPRRVIVLCAIAVVAGTVGMLALLRPSGDKGVQPPIAGPMVFATPSEQPTTQSPSPEPGFTGAESPGIVPPGPQSTVKPATAHSSAPAVTPTHKPSHSAAPTTASLTPGSTIGLEVADRPGLRVRHRDFGVRVDQLSASSSSGDRADSRFTVRKGLASADCLSFEAVDQPGYYLRHRVYDMVLDRKDNTTLFGQEATFCAKPVRGGKSKAFTLVTFYPSDVYGVVAGWDGTVRVAYTMQEPTRFVVRKPL